MSDVHNSIGQAGQPDNLPADSGGHRGPPCQPDLLQPGWLAQPPDILVQRGSLGASGQSDRDQGPADLQPPLHPAGQGGRRLELPVHCVEQSHGPETEAGDRHQASRQM